MVEALALVGTPEECVAKLKTLETTGIQHINIRPFFSASDRSEPEFDQFRLTEIFEKKIIPQFR